MLVFTRKVGEAIVIGGDIAITVVRVGLNDVRIGIDAPEATPIARDDVGLHRKKRANRAGGAKADRSQAATHSTE